MPVLLSLLIAGIALAITAVVGSRRADESARDLRRAGGSDEGDPYAAARRGIGRSSWMRIGGGGI